MKKFLKNLLQLLHESSLHRRDRNHQHRVYATGRPTRHRSDAGDARTARGWSAGRRQDADGGYGRRRRRGASPGGRDVRRRGGLDRVHPGADRARFEAVSRAYRAVRLHQLRQRLSEASRRLSDHRIHAACQPVLAILARQNRLRRTADAGLSRRGFPDHHRASLADLRRDADHACDQQLGKSRIPRWTACGRGRR